MRILDDTPCSHSLFVVPEISLTRGTAMQWRFRVWYRGRVAVASPARDCLWIWWINSRAALRVYVGPPMHECTRQQMWVP